MPTSFKSGFIQLFGHPPTAILNLCGSATPLYPSKNLWCISSDILNESSLPYWQVVPLHDTIGRIFAPVPPVSKPSFAIYFLKSSILSNGIP